MRKSRFSEEQIVGILKEQEAGAGTAALCRRHGISQQTFYRWRQRYGGLDRGEVRRLKALEEENARLKRLVAEQALDLQALKELLRKNGPCAGGAPWRMKMATAILSRPAGGEAESVRCREPAKKWSPDARVSTLSCAA